MLALWNRILLNFYFLYVGSNFFSCFDLFIILDLSRSFNLNPTQNPDKPIKKTITKTTIDVVEYKIAYFFIIDSALKVIHSTKKIKMENNTKKSKFGK